MNLKPIALAAVASLATAASLMAEPKPRDLAPPDDPQRPQAPRRKYTHPATK